MPLIRAAVDRSHQDHTLMISRIELSSMTEAQRRSYPGFYLLWSKQIKELMKLRQDTGEEPAGYICEALK